MAVFDGQRRCFDDSAQLSASNECVRLIRKLRWIGMDDEAERDTGATKRVALSTCGNRNRWSVGNGHDVYHCSTQIVTIHALNYPRAPPLPAALDRRGIGRLLCCDGQRRITESEFS
jgi:hypothetical protein